MLAFPGRVDGMVYLRFTRRHGVRLSGREVMVGSLTADAVFPAAGFFLAVFLNDRQCGSAGTARSVGSERAISKVLLGCALLLRFLGLLFRLLDHFVGGMSRQGEAGLPIRVDGSVHLIGTRRFALDFLLRLGETYDEFDEAIAVGFRWDRRYLGFVVRHAFPQMFCAFDQAILDPGSVKHELLQRKEHLTWVKQSITPR